MLTLFDDYPIHQTPEPLARPATNDRNAYDRYWFNGLDLDGDFYFGIGMGRYPHLGILDGALSIATSEGRQHSCFVSGRAPHEPSTTAMGPLRLEVVEPMRVTRVVLDDNETGISGELLFRARSACIEEGRQVWQPGSRRQLDNTRFAQYGTWEGEIVVDGRTLSVDPATTRGTKDRSWGIRPIGDPDPGGAPATDLPTFWFLWNPVHWEDHCSHVGLFEHPDGRPWHTDASVVPAYPDPAEVPGVVDPDRTVFHRVRHDIDWLPGTRWARAAELSLEAHDGTTKEIALEPLLRFHMKGIGYRHPEWSHGTWKGELAIGSDAFVTSEADPLAIENLHVQQLVRARSGVDTGVGALEQLVIGPYVPAGLEGYFDGAP